MAFSVSPTTGFNFADSLFPAEKIAAAKYFSDAATTTAGIYDKAKDLNLPIEGAFGPNAPDITGALGIKVESFLSGFGASSEPAWTFITAPEDVSWDTANQANRIDIFGTNNPPVVAGSRGMRDLTLSNALVEGFVRGVTVEAKVAALEKLMEYKLNASDGFVSVPVYRVQVSDKKYGQANGGYFIIKDVKVKEAMRDLRGDATRAYVDVSFMQVPAYQVNTGRDQASKTTAGADVRVNPVAPGGNSQANNAGANGSGVAGTTANGGSTSAGSKPAAGQGTPAPRVQAKEPEFGNPLELY